ncbi:MAG: hypothetical protein ACPGVS_09750 [Primorskyibacter sp.]
MIRVPGARAWGIVMAFALAGCAPGVDENLYGGVSYRDQSAPIGVSSRYDYEKMRGLWFIRQLTPDDLASTRVFFFEGEDGGDRVNEVRRACQGKPDGRSCLIEYVIDDTSSGALSLHRVGPGADREFVVHWVDDRHRTMAVGAANGRYAWVLDRSSDGGEDRIKAALEILDFYGYDTSVMQAKERERLQ